MFALALKTMAYLIAVVSFVLLFDCGYLELIAINKSNYSVGNILDSLETLHQQQLMRSIIFIDNVNTTLPSEFLINPSHVKAPVYHIDLQTISIGKYAHPIVKEEAKLFIVIINLGDDFDTNMKKIRKLPFWKTRDYIIFVTTFKLKKEKLMQNYFKICWKYFILNVLFVNKKLSIYSYNPFLKNMRVKKEKNFEFPKTIANVHGRKLKLVYFEIKSFFGTAANKTFKDKDVALSKTLMKSMNATYEFVSPNDGSFRGKCNNTHATGALKLLIEDGGDIVMNEITYINQTCGGKIEYSYPHDKSDIVIAIQKQKPILRNLGNVFPTFLWVILLISMIVFFIYLKMVKNSPTFVEIIFIIVLLITGQAAKELKIKFFRIALCATVVLLIFFNTIFQSRLISFLTVPQPDSQMKTIDEFLDSGETFLCTRTCYMLIDKSFEGEQRRKLLQKIVVVSDTEFFKKVLNCQGAFGIPKYYLELLDIKRCFYTLREILVKTVRCYTLRKGSPFLSTMNEFLIKIRENGLLDYWKKQITPQEDIEFSEQPTITLKSLLIVFYILFGGHILGCIVFVLEISWKAD